MKYELIVYRGRQIRLFKPFDETSLGWLENETLSQCDIDETIAWFDTKDEALAELAKHKNSFFGDELVDTEIYSVLEWQVDEDGELESANPIAYAEWSNR